MVNWVLFLQLLFFVVRLSYELLNKVCWRFFFRECICSLSLFILFISPLIFRLLWSTEKLKIVIASCWIDPFTIMRFLNCSFYFISANLVILFVLNLLSDFTIDTLPLFCLLFACRMFCLFLLLTFLYMLKVWRFKHDIIVVV